MADSDLWGVAIREVRLLITTDKGFTEYRAVPHPGIRIVRLVQPNRTKIHQSLMHMVAIRQVYRRRTWTRLLYQSSGASDSGNDFSNCSNYGIRPIQLDVVATVGHQDLFGVLRKKPHPRLQ